MLVEAVDGVAGLVEACRRDNVAVANPLGSGVGECAALLPFIPRLTRTLLGEDLGPLLPDLDLPPWLTATLDALSMVVAGALNLLGLRDVVVVGRLAELAELNREATRARQVLDSAAAVGVERMHVQRARAVVHSCWSFW